MNPLLLAGAAALAADMLSDEGRAPRRLNKAEKEIAHAGVAEALAMRTGKIKRGARRVIDEKLVFLEKALGHDFRRPGFLEDALTHASAARPKNNERIEFLGDRILNFVLAEWMYLHFDHLNEDQLTKLFGAATANDFLSERARKLHLQHFAYLGKSLTPDNLSDKTLGGFFEAIVGALYLDAGLKPAREFIVREITPHLGSMVNTNYKTQLKDWAAQQGKEAIFWAAGKKTGPEHAPMFRFKAMLVLPGQDPRKFGEVVGIGKGATKLKAEQAAAKMALFKLGLIDGDAKPMAHKPVFVAKATEQALEAMAEAPTLRAA